MAGSNRSNPANTQAENYDTIILKMRTNLVTVTVLAILANLGHTTGIPSQQLCQGTSFVERGSTYCQKVQRIVYQKVGRSGQYQEVVGMDPKTGTCEFAAREFSWPLAPFDEPVSSSSVVEKRTDLY